MTSFQIHQVSLSMDKRLSRGGGRRLPDFCLSSTRPMPYFPRSWIFVLYLVALFQKCPRFFWVPCPVICLACVLAGPDWLDSLPLYMLPLSEVVKKFSTNQLQSLPSPPPLIHAAPTSVARFEFRRLTPKTDQSLEAWLHMFLHFGIHMYVYFIIPKDSLWVGESEDTEQSLLRLSWERWGHFYHFSDNPEFSQRVC